MIGALINLLPEVQLLPKADLVLVDGNQLIPVSIPRKTIVDGIVLADIPLVERNLQKEESSSIPPLGCL